MNDLYREVTNRVVTALEHGTPPWVRPWSSIPEAIPMNAQTRRQYRGVNFTLLSLRAEGCWIRLEVQSHYQILPAWRWRVTDIPARRYSMARFAANVS